MYVNNHIVINDLNYLKIDKDDFYTIFNKGKSDLSE